MLRNKQIAVLGYGSQGRAWALNLNDSGYRVLVGLRSGSNSMHHARKAGMEVTTVNRAAASSDIVIIALPDHLHGQILNDNFFDKLKSGTALVFLHGTSIHFNLVNPPADIPILLLAPHAPGQAVRENYLNKKPFSAFYAVHRGSKKAGAEVIKELARAVGIPATHLIKTDFKTEAIGDVFGEQAVLCGGLARLLKLGFETLVESGIPPANAYLEIAYQIDLIVSLIKKHGLSGMFDRISPLARFGSAINGPTVIPDDAKKRMKKILNQIENGNFVKKVRQSGPDVTPKQLSLITNESFDRQAIKFAKRDND